MSDYIGEKCISCEGVFTAEDTIVVCPYCGTPYHKECYEKEGKCINNILHSKNESWKSVMKKNAEKEDTVKCNSCGEENPVSGLFCSKCGVPLNRYSKQENFNNQNASPIFNQAMEQIANEQKKYNAESEIDGIKIKEYNEYIGSSHLYFLSNFLRFSKFKTKFSANIIAFLIPELYFFYRKMNIIGIIVLILSVAFTSPLILMMLQNNNIINTIVSEQTLVDIYQFTNFFSIALKFGCATFANWLYFRKAKKDINLIKDKNLDSSIVVERIKEKGGVSIIGAFTALVIPILLSLITALVLRYI